MISLACRPPFATPTANNIAIGLSMPGWRRRWPGPAAGAEMLGGGLIAVSALWCECHLALHTSFPPGLTRPTAHETYFATLPDVVGTEVGISLVRLSPHRGFLEHLRLSPRATLGPGARVRTPRRRRNAEGGDGRWSCCIDAVVVLTFTKRRWWLACGLYPMARRRRKFVPSRRPRRTFC